MAYISQADKAKIANQIKPLLKQFGLKGSLSIQNHSTIVLTVKSGAIDFIGNYIEADRNKSYAKNMSEDQVAYIRKTNNIRVNTYWFQEHFTGVAKEFLIKAIAALRSAGWYDNSDAMTDYFDVKYYIDIKIGRWDQPYTVST